jgi:RND family efflux transporter MFP subunit
VSDLEALRIDRSKQSVRRTKRRAGGLGWWVLLALAAGAAWLFRGPALRAIDRVRLPEVTVFRARETSALAAGAVSGTAANGYIVASVRAALSADTPGRIVEMNVTEGSVVKKGDVVARLYADEYRAELRRAEADLLATDAAVRSAEARRAVAGADVNRLRSDAAAAEAALEESLATRKLAEITLARAERLVAENVQSEQMLDEARASRDQAAAAEKAAASRRDAALAAVSQAEIQLGAAAAAVEEAAARVPVAEAVRDRAAATLEKTEVRAPFDGIVVLKDAEVGEVVSPNAVGTNSRGSVVTMVDFDSLEVQVEVPETSLAAVALGASAKVFLDAYPTVTYAGRVERIWPTANRQKATVEVRVAFDRPDERLRPEMGARVVFTADGSEDPAETPQGILVPSDCVVSVEGRRGLFVLERDVVQFRQVVTGEERSGRILIESGLNEGEQVVASPPSSLSSGDRVQVSE